MNQINQKIIEYYIENPNEMKRVEASIDDFLIKHKCIYHDKPVPLLPTPFIISSDLLEEISYSCKLFAQIITKVISLADDDEGIANFFDWTCKTSNWAKFKSAIGTKIFFSRFDALLSSFGELKFVEFNTDNPGGKSWCHLFNMAFWEQKDVSDLIKSDCVEPVDSIIPSIVEGVKELGLEFFGDINLRVAYVDILDESGILEEHLGVVNALIESGVDAFLFDARRFSYQNGDLLADGKKVHIVIRGMQIKEFLEFEGLSNIIDAYRDGNIVLLNSFRSSLGSQKSLLALLCDRSFWHYFTKEEQIIIDKMIPKTYLLSQKLIYDELGNKHALYDYIKSNKDKFVLKPSSGSGGRGVIIGYNVEEKAWIDLIETHIGDPFWVVQELVPFQKYFLPVNSEDGIKLLPHYININPYIINSKFTSLNIRYSADPVINIESGGGVLPFFISKN